MIVNDIDIGIATDVDIDIVMSDDISNYHCSNETLVLLGYRIELSFKVISVTRGVGSLLTRGVCRRYSPCRRSFNVKWCALHGLSAT